MPPNELDLSDVHSAKDSLELIANVRLDPPPESPRGRAPLCESLRNLSVTRIGPNVAPLPEFIEVSVVRVDPIISRLTNVGIMPLCENGGQN